QGSRVLVTPVTAGSAPVGGNSSVNNFFCGVAEAPEGVPPPETARKGDQPCSSRTDWSASLKPTLQNWLTASSPRFKPPTSSPTTATFPRKNWKSACT